MRFFEPLELCFQKVEPFRVSDDRRLSRFMGGFEIGRRKGAAQAMVGDHLIHPSEALEMVPVELARLRCTHRGQNPLRIPAKDRAVRHVGRACDGKRSRMAFPSSSFGGAFDVIPALPPCVWTSTEMDLRRTSSAS